MVINNTISGSLSRMETTGEFTLPIDEQIPLYLIEDSFTKNW